MFVTTETMTKSQQLFLNLKLVPLEDSVRQKVGFLIEELQKSSLFSLDAITSWKTDFDKDSLTTPEELDEASLKLCYLLCEIVRPAIVHDEVTIVHFEDKIREILQLILPKNETVDAFIDQFEIYAKEARLLNKQTQQVDDLFQKKFQELEEALQQAHETHTTKFEEHKATLLESIKGHEQEVNKLHDKLDALGEKFNTTHDELSGAAKKMHTIALNLQKEQLHFQQVAKEGVILLNQVKQL